MARVDLHWIPLGAGEGPAVRWSGRLYEAIVSRRDRRPACDLFHSALVVTLDDGSTWAIEMAPVWDDPHHDHGSVGEGAVGLPWLGRVRLFRYEIRCWRDGVIPDLAFAAGGPTRLEATDDTARRVLAEVAACPTPTWGIDELGTGDMWNSNSVVAWALMRAGLDLTDVAPPPGGRAPGWAAGLRAAATTAAA